MLKINTILLISLFLPISLNAQTLAQSSAVVSLTIYPSTQTIEKNLNNLADNDQLTTNSEIQYNTSDHHETSTPPLQVRIIKKENQSMIISAY